MKRSVLFAAISMASLSPVAFAEETACMSEPVAVAVSSRVTEYQCDAISGGEAKLVLRKNSSIGRYLVDDKRKATVIFIDEDFVDVRPVRSRANPFTDDDQAIIDELIAAIEPSQGGSTGTGGSSSTSSSSARATATVDSNGNASTSFETTGNASGSATATGPNGSSTSTAPASEPVAPPASGSNSSTSTSSNSVSSQSFSSMVGNTANKPENNGFTTTRSSNTSKAVARAVVDAEGNPITSIEVEGNASGSATATGSQGSSTVTAP